MDLLRHPPFDTRQLRYFLAIVEAGSFTRAARTLNVAQPALSQTIKEMETDLGLELLVRRPRGVVPTAAGKLLTQEARTILTQIQVARERLQDEGAAPSGSVGLGLPTSISHMVVMPMVQTVLARFPKIQFHASEAMSTHLIDWVLDGQLDLGIVFSSMGRKGLRIQPVLREELVLVGNAEQAPIGAGEEFTWPALGQMDFVLPGSAFGIRKLIDAADSMGSVPFNLVAEVDSLWHIKSLVQKGIGFSILTKSVIQQEIEDGTLRSWPIRNPPIRRTVNIVTSSERPLSQAVQSIELVLCAMLYKLVEQGFWEAELMDELLERYDEFEPFIPPMLVRSEIDTGMASMSVGE
jgi:LysR family nitrogen assimilation transcriptional regulator